MFANIPEVLIPSMDVLPCKINLPHHDRLVYAQ